MKKSIISIFLLFIGIQSFTYAQDTSESALHTNEIAHSDVEWEENFEKAMKIAKKKQKPLLVFFTGSDWCGPCKKLHVDFFETDEFIDIANKDLVLYEADFPRRKDLVSEEKKVVNYKIKSKYGVRGYPTIIILKPNGKEFKRRVGYNMRDTELHFQLIKDAVQSIRK